MPGVSRGHRADEQNAVIAQDATAFVKRSRQRLAEVAKHIREDRRDASIGKRQFRRIRPLNGAKNAKGFGAFDCGLLDVDAMSDRLTAI